MSRPEDERKKRLVEALRENLRRRRAQARGTRSADPAVRDGNRDGDGDKDTD